jgi:hypothetical protein
MIKMTRALALLPAVGIWLGASSIAHAALVGTWTGTSGNLSASATFETSGQNLVVTLVNTSTHDVLAPGDVLTAVFFDIDPTASLTRVSAVLGTGSSVLFGGTDPGNVVGGEWAYDSGLSGAPGNAVLGISSAGFDLFGPGDRFPGNNLQGPDSPDGVQYGITSQGDNPLTGNGGITGQALIQNSVVFTLGLPANYTLQGIDNVTFQYGTALDETSIPGVPEPTTMIAGALLLLPFGVSTLRILRKKCTA